MMWLGFVEDVSRQLGEVNAVLVSDVMVSL